MILCDTHALLLDAMAPRELGKAAAQAIETGYQTGSLACADISLWEIAMLVEKKRVTVDSSTANFLMTLLANRRLAVLPITPAIAALAGSPRLPPGDPADRLITATALAHDATLVTKDKQLQSLEGLHCVW